MQIGSYAMTHHIAILFTTLIFLCDGGAWAGAKKPSPPSGSGCPVTPVVAKPTRPVLLGLTGTKEFELPGHRKVDISPFLADMASTETGKTNVFAPAHQNSSPCDTHLELVVAVGTLELNLTTLGITIGYSPTGIHTGITEVQGNVDVKVSQMSMEFSLNECNSQGCTQRIASSVNQNMFDTESKFTVNFGQITGGLDLVTHPSFNNFLRKMLTKGLTDLANSPKVNLLPWRATVQEVNAGAGTLIFDAGANVNLFSGQNFAVYAVTPTTGECHVYRVIAYIHTARVDLVSSLAAIDAVLDARNIQEGDIVMIKPQ